MSEWKPDMPPFSARDIRHSLAYLASPYSLYPHGLQAAFEEASRISAKLLIAGVKNYSPIAHTHGLAIYGNLDPMDARIWFPLNDTMMAICDVLIVARMPGWSESVGVAREIEHFRDRRRPIYGLDPATLAMVREVEIA